MRRKGLLIIIFVFVLLSVGCQTENTHIEREPDCVSSISFGRDYNLNIVANRDEIEDKLEFAKLLIEKCKDNSFETILFSTDHGYATSLDMDVYLWEDEIEGYDPVMKIQYKQKEWNPDYDIVNNPDQYEIYIDGELS